MQDYGKGIPPADLPHLFSRFYQTERADKRSKGGMGLGLYIARELIAAHGGRITAASEEGKGASFTISLPLVPAEEAPGAASSASP